MKGTTIKERLARVETLLENHLKHHEMLEKYISFPILVGVVLLVSERVFNYIQSMIGG